jgi:GDPmannose 4,6-dehydratase
MKAFITGCDGQDGHYLSKFLLEKKYDVYGLVRRSAQEKKIPDGITIVEGDVTDQNIIRTIEKIDPDEIYNLAAMSHVGESFKIPHTTFEINACGTLNVLEGARLRSSKFYQASSSELFGNSLPPQNENTSFYPRSPYAVSKLAAYWATVNYRESYGLFAVNGILFNHESPLRGNDFVTQKVAKYCAYLRNEERGGHILLPQHLRVPKLKLGNLDAQRDWGHAEDFVEGMWLMMQQPKADDYVLATGISRSVRELLDVAFKYIGPFDWKRYVESDPSLFRPSDVNSLCGDASKAKEIGWEPKKTFEQTIAEMIDVAASY